MNSFTTIVNIQESVLLSPAGLEKYPSVFDNPLLEWKFPFGTVESENASIGQIKKVNNIDGLPTLVSWMVIILSSITFWWSRKAGHHGHLEKSPGAYLQALDQ